MASARASAASWAAEFGVRIELSEPIFRAIPYLPISRAFMNMAFEPSAMVELAS